MENKSYCGGRRAASSQAGTFVPKGPQGQKLRLQLQGGFVESIVRKADSIFENAIATFGRTPQAIDITDIRANAGHGYFEKALPLGCLEKKPFFLRQAMPDSTASDFRTRRLAMAQPLHIVLVRSWHL
jgi:hypothetical protein